MIKVCLSIHQFSSLFFNHGALRESLYFPKINRLPHIVCLWINNLFKSMRGFSRMWSSLFLSSNQCMVCRVYKEGIFLESESRPCEAKPWKVVVARGGGAGRTFPSEELPSRRFSSSKAFGFPSPSRSSRHRCRITIFLSPWLSWLDLFPDWLLVSNEDKEKIS